MPYSGEREIPSAMSATETLYERLLRPLLFASGGGDPENVHHRVTAAAAAAPPALWRALLALRPVPQRPVKLLGLDFPNPVGLAAGFDKEAALLWPCAYAGFGFVEVGTVTLAPQPGNPRPRIFRRPEAAALVNRMGFPSSGADAAVRRLSSPNRTRLPVPVGVNIGKNKATPLEAAAEEYVRLLGLLAPYADYVTVNVSSPNTPDLRRLQEPERLAALLQALTEAARTLPRPVPVLVKLSPDLSEAELCDTLDVARAHAQGVIATNTTIARTEAQKAAGWPEGGVSGAPLRERAVAVVAACRARLGPGFPLIGVGGIATAEDARAHLDAGADLVQLYTALIYRGPFLPRDIVRGLSKPAAG